MALNPEQAEQIRKKFLEQIEKFPEDKKEYKEQLRQQILVATPEQLEAALKPQKEGKEVECIFCSIAKGETDSVKIYEDNYVIAFLDINPSKAGQTIIIPKEHQQFIFQLSDQTLWSMMKATKLLEPFVVNATKAGGLSIYISQGDMAGQYFKHLAIYLIPRFEDDKAAFYWQRNEAKREDLEAIAKIIKGDVDKILQEEKQKREQIIKEKQKAVMKDEKIYEVPRRV